MQKLQPLPNSPLNLFSNIRLIATDMDGTLTTRGKFTSQLLEALQDLARAGIKVIITTGRSAGWVSGLSSYLPVAGAIAENGGIFYPNGNEQPIPLTPITDFFAHRQNLATAFAKLQAKFPQIQESADNRFRVTDWTFSITELSRDTACRVPTEELIRLNDLCESMGLGFTYSTVQCHIQPQGQNKAVGLLKVLQSHFGEISTQQIVTVGDSPNDESLFDASYFPISVGVANVLEYADKLQHTPVYVTNAAEGEGFCELAQNILRQIC